jgi:hypothetical protein
LSLAFEEGAIECRSEERRVIAQCLLIDFEGLRLSTSAGRDSNHLLRLSIKATVSI